MEKKKPNIISYLDDTNYNTLLSVIDKYAQETNKDAYLQIRTMKLRKKLQEHTFVDMQEDEEGEQTPFAKMAFFDTEIEPLIEVLTDYIYNNTDIHGLYSERYFSEIMEREGERKLTNPNYSKFHKEPPFSENEQDEITDKPF